MTVEPLGEEAYIVRHLKVPAYALANAINAAPPRGVLEAVPAYDTLGIFVERDVTVDPDWLSNLQPKQDFERHHDIPVCYELGEDLSAVAKALGIDEQAVIAAHTAEAFRCHAVGFCPGFAYLGYLPPAISGVPRRATPRIRVEPGSVAIADRQTAVYPLHRPGGWNLIGKTPLTLVDEADAYFPIQAGDLVRFVPIDESAYQHLTGERL